MTTNCQYCGSEIATDLSSFGGVFRCMNCLHLNVLLPRNDEGMIVFDDFLVFEEVGQGANAVVCRVQTVSGGDIRALKMFITTGSGGDDHAAKEFVRASRVAEEIKHRNVVRLYGAGEWHGTHYLVQEFVDGINLSQYLDNYGPMDQFEALSLGSYVCAALDFVWSNFLMIHRDIKPHNIMLTQEGEVKICDFGMLTSHERAVVDIAAVEGTPYYLSPECIEDGAYTDNRSDVYSLGATLFHLITGVPPFDYESVLDVLDARTKEPPPDIRDHLSVGDARVASLLKTMMARDPEDRYVTATECLEDMQRVVSGTEPRLVDPNRPRVNA